MDSNEAPPPPYSVDDPFVASANNNSSDNASTAISAAPLRLRGGDTPLHDIVLRDGSASSVNESSAVSLDLPANFESAAAYFVERPPTVFDGGRPILSHHLTIYPRSQSKDFPRRPRCWNSLTEEITQQDWDMFLRYLFPPHLGLAGSSAHLPRQVRAEIQRDRKDRPQETDEQRQSRITAVIAEWNECFFEPRATQVAFIYVTDLETAPQSSLCPKCYPAATRSVQTSEASRNPVPVHPDTPSPAPGQQTGSPASSGHAPGMYSYQNPHIPPGPYAPYGPYPFHPAGAPNTPPPNAYLPPHFQQPLPWGWNNQPFNPHHQSSSTPKGGPLGWIASLASQAQKYGERISEQAQQYGDHISAQAQRYGRQVEEQAIAHGRWIEEQADFQGQRVKETFTGFGPRPRGEWSSTDPRAHAYYPHTHQYAQASPNNTSPNTSPNTSQQMDAPPPQRSRRPSVSSVSSGSSLTSIDSISTTSDLSSSDLATIRAQLLSLEDHHDRDLYEAAVGLRRELDVLQASRRQMRVSGRGHWGDVWGHHRGYRRGDRGSWGGRQNPAMGGFPGGVRGNGIGPGRGGGRGRWESPQQHERSSAERRAVKEEMRATKKAFKDVLRRAREEQRERIRAKRNRRRQEKKCRNSQREGVPTPELPLEQHLENLELGNNRENSAVQSSVPGSSTTRSVSSEASLVSTPSTVMSEANEGKAQSKEARKQAKEQQKQAEKKRKEQEKLLRKNKDTAPPGDR